ncbi:M20/M25/M40 family metallo-hydrolase [Merismopedia glauca]|uniref:Peptidase M28 n=1 Tax=Merismopedia glauca CCAP 1448/3 TaxID=1296344 RepID=A0A2T1C065_9CYAN|nr:M20/M25/M40 family metallo-hydrolase [Merismopedia glauca]PSB01513.1 peptidase M28 [Merismopedia glauca CCAP 1448/3]
MKKWLWLPLAAIFFVGCAQSFPQETSTQDVGTSEATEPSPITPATLPNQSTLVEPMSQANLLRHVKALGFARYSQSDRLKARQYIINNLKSAGWSVTLQTFKDEYADGVNIIAERSQKNAQVETILVGAHYDTVPRSPGADDNGTGVATILEIARITSSLPTKKNLKLVFFDQEEIGLKGSLAFTSRPNNVKRLSGAIIIDMLGFACNTPGCQTFPEGLPVTLPTDTGDFILVAGDTEHPEIISAFDHLPNSNFPSVVKIPVPFKGLSAINLLRSDHAPFWLRNIGAVIVTDTANFRNPHYHQPTDIYNTIDRNFFTNSAQIVANATIKLLEI